jgi:tetratricopeptide (TPR) repeat protein
VEIRRKRYRPALDDLEKALALQREHLPAEHPEVASTLNNIGTVLTRLGRFEEAIRSYQQSLAIHEAVEGATHPNTATSAHNLAVTYRLLGRLTESKALFERALSARRSALGPRHPDTLNSGLSLAKVCIALGELETAAQLLAEVRAARDEASTPKELWSLLEVEAELSLTGRFWREAQQTSKQMLLLARELQPGDSPLASSALVVQGRALTGLGAWAEARKVLHEASAQLEARDEKHRDEKDVVELDEALGHLEVEQGHSHEALPYLTRALAVRDASAIPSRGLALLLQELARVDLELSQPAAGQAYAERSLKLLEGMQAPLDLQRARYLSALCARLSADAGEPSLEPLLAELPLAERPAARQWLGAHGLETPDAGR